jgi:molybdopterin-guanine dinucleotide biosynthesis protein A
MTEPHDITGLVLAGGQGSRLGGVDKGLQDWHGQPLVQHALDRLAPQVGRLMVSANRHREVYERLGVPVWPDPSCLSGYQGPLAGVLAGLAQCETPWLLTVPCDCPRFPSDLAHRLCEALEDDTELAIAATPKGLEPAFCLMRRNVEASLRDYLQSGERRIERWTSTLRRAEARFEDASAFFNINTPDDLARA